MVLAMFFQVHKVLVDAIKSATEKLQENENTGGVPQHGAGPETALAPTYGSGKTATGPVYEDDALQTSTGANGPEQCGTTPGCEGYSSSSSSSSSSPSSTTHSVVNEHGYVSQASATLLDVKVDAVRCFDAVASLLSRLEQTGLVDVTAPAEIADAFTLAQWRVLRRRKSMLLPPYTHPHTTTADVNS